MRNKRRCLMKTKYDIDDEVLIMAKICRIESDSRGIIRYGVKIKGFDNFVYMTEEHIPYMYIRESGKPV